ncbi:MAG: Rieske 2Fe-2S domain-containing protein [Deltaproteobacteria bacterium]|nr:Rieske 2Fe-2S domain-containing protein [Deltaproteobacteria bacterium]
MGSRWMLLLRAELDRRKLLRGGALLSAVVALPSVGCGASSPDGSSTTGATGGTTTAGSTTTGASQGGFTGTTNGGSINTSTSGGSSASTGATGSGSTGTTGCSTACTQDANTFVIPVGDIPLGGGKIYSDARFTDQQCSAPGAPYSQFVVLQPTAGTFTALSTGCTHQCCSVRPMSNHNRNFLYCNCHGSGFDFYGNVLQGPATVPLTSIPVCTDGCNIYVQLA